MTKSLFFNSVVSGLLHRLILPICTGLPIIWCWEFVNPKRSTRDSRKSEKYLDFYWSEQKASNVCGVKSPDRYHILRNMRYGRWSFKGCRLGWGNETQHKHFLQNLVSKSIFIYQPYRVFRTNKPHIAILNRLRQIKK